jgi:hypothetical protein
MATAPSAVQQQLQARGHPAAFQFASMLYYRHNTAWSDDMLGMALVMAAAILGATPKPQSLQPRAQVGAHMVTKPGEPRLRIKVPTSARYAGGERFLLYGNADCELHVFVDADAAKRIRRFYWVQFEDFLPTSPDARYTYGKRDRGVMLWGGKTWISSGFGRTDFATRAGSDREHLRGILERAGYTAPATMMQVRLVRLLDDPGGTGFGRRELMLIYAEDLALSGEDFEALGGEGEDTARWREIEPALVKRASNAFAVGR